MAKSKKPSLKKALEKIDKMPESLFGSIEIDISTLPCINKPAKEKITANIDSDLLAEIKLTAKKHGVSYTTLMNDILREVFIKDKKAG